MKRITHRLRRRIETVLDHLPDQPKKLAWCRRVLEGEMDDLLDGLDAEGLANIIPVEPGQEPVL